MLEIVLLMALCWQIGAVVRRKGQKPIGYQVLAVVLWFGGEFAGVLVGHLAAPRLPGALGQSELPFVYLHGLLGGALGAGLAYTIACNVRPPRRGIDRHDDLGPFVDLDAAAKSGPPTSRPSIHSDSSFASGPHAFNVPPLSRARTETDPPKPTPVEEPPSERFPVRCGGCRAVYPASVELLGRTVRCPRCGEDMYVSRPGEAAAVEAPAVTRARTLHRLRQRFFLLACVTVLGWGAFALTFYCKAQYKAVVRELPTHVYFSEAHREADQRRLIWWEHMDLAWVCTWGLFLVGAAVFVALLATLWETVGTTETRGGPALIVGLLFVPLVNVLLVIPAIGGLARALNRTAAQTGLQRRTSTALAFLCAVITALALGAVTLNLFLPARVAESPRRGALLRSLDGLTDVSRFPHPYQIGVFSLLAAQWLGLYVLGSQVRLAREILLNRSE